MLSSTSPRQHELERQVPDVVDLTVMAVESGLGLDGALDFIGNRLQGPLAAEVREASRQAQRSPDPAKVWLTMATRVGLPDFSDFLSAVLQARQTGVSLGNVLRQKSAEIRERRLQQARQEANQLPVKLVVVNVVLVPCMIVQLVSFLLLPGWLMLALLIVGAVLLAQRTSGQRHERDRDRAEQQVADCLTLAASSLRVGHGLDQSLDTAAQSAAEPVGTELRAVAAALKAGEEPVAAFDRLSGRLDSRELSLITTALELQRRHGGALADLLARVAQVLGDRVRIRGEIRALTAQSQFSTHLMTGIPLGLAVIARLVGIKLLGLIPIGPNIPALLIVGILAVQAGVFRLVRRTVSSVDRFLP